MFTRTLRRFSLARPAPGPSCAPATRTLPSADAPVCRQALTDTPQNRPGRWTPRLLALLIPAIFVLPAKAAGTSVSEIIDTPFEQLLQTDVITAEKLAKQISGAPSAVSVVTAQDIKDFGYRTLSDILASMRGLNMSHDDSYGFLSGRGFANPRDYAGRITTLIDGYRAPDNLWGQTYFGNDGLLDVELIERVEYIPGSGSSSYGDSAFLGVINIITKKGRDLGGTQVSGELGSHDLYRERVAFGQKFASGLDLLFSASTLSSHGRRLPPEFGDSSAGLYEKDKNQRFFLKAAYGGWTFESASADRSLPSPDDLAAHSLDRNAYASLKYDTEFASDLKSSTHFYLGHTRYREYTADGWRARNDGGDWWGIDSKLVTTHFSRQTVILGAEYRDDFRQSLWRQDSPGDPLDNRQTHRQTWSLYAYDDLQLSNNWQLNFGGRADTRDNGSTTFSPRAAVIYVPTDGTTLKLSTGLTSRQPTANNELNRINPTVEHLQSNELVWEQSLGAKTRLTTALYSYHIQDYETNWIDGPYPGTDIALHGSLSAKGAEFELEHLWDNGVRLRTSYTRQDATTSDGIPMKNLAQNIAKFNLSAPVAGNWLRTGLSIRYLGRHINWVGGYDPATVVGDLTLTGNWNHWFSSFSIRNIGDVKYTEVGRLGYYSDTWSYGADRRNFWFQLGYEFK